MHPRAEEGQSNFLATRSQDRAARHGGGSRRFIIVKVTSVTVKELMTRGPVPMYRKMIHPPSPKHLVSSLQTELRLIWNHRGYHFPLYYLVSLEEGERGPGRYERRSPSFPLCGEAWSGLPKKRKESPDKTLRVMLQLECWHCHFLCLQAHGMQSGLSSRTITWGRLDWNSINVSYLHTDRYDVSGVCGDSLTFLCICLPTVRPGKKNHYIQTPAWIIPSILHAADPHHHHHHHQNQSAFYEIKSIISVVWLCRKSIGHANVGVKGCHWISRAQVARLHRNLPSASKPISRTTGVFDHGRQLIFGLQRIFTPSPTFLSLLSILLGAVLRTCAPRPALVHTIVLSMSPRRGLISSLPTASLALSIGFVGFAIANLLFP